MRIATVQIVSGADPRANLDQVAEQTAQAAGEGAELVIFPEATMRHFGRSLAEVAESPEGPWASRLAEIAAQHAVVVVAGMFGPADGGRVTNTLRVVGPGVDARYDKIHLFDAFGFTESDTVARTSRWFSGSATWVSFRPATTSAARPFTTWRAGGPPDLRAAYGVPTCRSPVASC